VGPRVRFRTSSGQWLSIHASVLGEEAGARCVVILERAGADEIAPMIADAYGLTDREREVTQLVAQGLSTSAMSERLDVSPWTVQDHLKSIFEKTGAGTRGELVARVFFEHYAPRLAAER
jgi:DNA-binding CsgD family transcriptional regulator